MDIVRAIKFSIGKVHSICMNLKKWGSKLVLVTVEDIRNKQSNILWEIYWVFLEQCSFLSYYGWASWWDPPLCEKRGESIAPDVPLYGLNSKVHGCVLGCELNLINEPIVKYNAEFTLSAKSNITSTKIFKIFFKIFELTSFY